MVTYGELPTGWLPSFCNEFERSRKEPRSAHAHPGDYTMADLLDLAEHCVCPLHINPAYPEVPISVVSRDVERIIAHFDALTEENTGKPPHGKRGPWVVTWDQFHALVEKHPHGGEWLRDYADTIGLTLK